MRTEIQPLIVEQCEAITYLTLNRPHCGHAFNNTMLDALMDAITNLPTHTKAVVLKSFGTVFASGMDLKWFANPQTNCQLFADALSLWSQCPYPTLTVVQGHALGGALGWIAASDNVLASDHATFQLSEIQLGLVPAMIAPYLIKAVGVRHTTHWALSGQRFDAQWALRAGLIHQVHPSDQLDTAQQQLIDHLKHCPQSSLIMAKQIIDAHHCGQRNLYQEGAHLTQALKESAVGQEGLQAFLEKRKPYWETDKGS